MFQECDSSPCLNEASCIDLINKYACICPDGFVGKHCEVDVDMCLKASQNLSLCFNGGICQDGPGANFTCSCPTGYFGEYCELEVNECCSDPCLYGAICQDLINGYRCHCRPGWTGLHCEDDINECLPQPCSQGLCIQNVPGHGYTCFCRPGFVGKNCEFNYDDCLLQPCPESHDCVDGINNASCVPMATIVHAAPGLTPTPWGLLFPTPAPRSPALPAEDLQNASQPTGNTAESIPGRKVPVTQWCDYNPVEEDFSYVGYSGDSYMEFEVIDLGTVSNISVRFQSRASEGTILYANQGPAISDFFFIKLFIEGGELQYGFGCNQEEGMRRINTTIQVDDGGEYVVYVRQHFAPCEAEVMVSGYKWLRSTLSNYWSGLTIQRTGHLFIGGLPLSYPAHQGVQPFYNYTGCIEIMEINKLKGFYTSKAIGGCNVDNCRLPRHTDSPTDPGTSQWEQSTPTLVVDGAVTPILGLTPAEACHNAPCRNGGTCQPQRLLSGAASFHCDCPLHFTGPLCDQDAVVFFPSFDGTSCLELPSLTSLLEYEENEGAPSSPEVGDVVTLYLTVKSNSSQGSVLYTREEHFGDRFLHVFLESGRPAVKLGCGGAHVLMVEASQSISWERLTPITIRYCLPVGEDGGHCGIEITVDDIAANRQHKYLFHPLSQVTFGPLFLGGVPSHSELHESAGQVTGLQGCIRELQVNSRELYIVDEAVRGRNIQNCDAPLCQHHPCHNGGTCVSYINSLRNDLYTLLT
ncbi:hypothetical protein AAFF_G00291400 [Aldrovandia affinis]|uniref:Protein eyes shut homolog n=1 Tax=Aldrovandia affinis TaxID=143900 RepID=A0AAD7SQC9_9TELE|nr:hypothetical protein AAFF_G00291400 [Aldrovandia affinis]